MNSHRLLRQAMHHDHSTLALLLLLLSPAGCSSLTSGDCCSHTISRASSAPRWRCSNPQNSCSTLVADCLQASPSLSASCSDFSRAVLWSTASAALPPQAAAGGRCSSLACGPVLQMLLSCLAASKVACTGSGAPVLLLLSLLLAMPDQLTAICTAL
jgi:hypothetical protein